MPSAGVDVEEVKGRIVSAMGRSQRRHKSTWGAKLAPVQTWPLPSATPEWTREIAEVRVFRKKPQQTREGVQVLFPLSFGIGSGVGGCVDSGGLMLRLARVEGGCGGQNGHELDHNLRYLTNLIVIFSKRIQLV